MVNVLKTIHNVVGFVVFLFGDNMVKVIYMILLFICWVFLYFFDVFLSCLVLCFGVSWCCMPYSAGKNVKKWRISAVFLWFLCFFVVVY